MSQKSTRFDEFESLFRSSVRPHLEVEPLPLNRLLIVVDMEGSRAKRDGTLRLAESMTEHFKTETLLLFPLHTNSPSEEDARQLMEETSEKLKAKGANVSGRVEKGFPAGKILEAIAQFQADLIVLPSLFGEKDESFEGYSLGAVVDKVLSETGKPILLVEGDIPEPEKLWLDMLLFIEEIGTSETCLAATRTLAAKEAEARMVHVIDSHMLALVERAFEVATELDTEKAREALKSALHKDMEHYLSGAKELLDRTGHRSEYSIEVGDPVEVCRRMIQEKGPHLVVCNSVSPEQRLVDSVAYNLAAYLRETPLLLV